MRKLPLIAVPAAVLAVAACGSAASSSASPVPSSAAATSAATPAAVPSLAPLTLGRFPSTTDGRLARRICVAWSGLRREYVARVTADTPYQLNQWFSGPDWSVIQAAGLKLNSASYGNLEGAVGAVTTGDTAGMGEARLLDKACEKAD